MNRTLNNRDIIRGLKTLKRPRRQFEGSNLEAVAGIATVLIMAALVLLAWFVTGP